MSASALSHQSVLCQEAVAALVTNRQGIYLDNTFGYGGHSRAILKQLASSGRLIALDKDPNAVNLGLVLSKTDKRFRLVHSDFAQAEAVLDRMNINQLDGVLFDLGVSSMQLDDPERGFSFRWNAPLDMRMDTTQGITAEAWLARADESEIAQVIKTYGEERFAKRIARAIAKERLISPIRTTGALATLVAQQVATREMGQHPATRTFQAIRIYINDELNALKGVLPKIIRRLKYGGKLVVISFHSLEDRIVKECMRSYSQVDRFPRWVNVKSHECGPPLLDHVDRIQRASEQEILHNARARSAVLRVARRSNTPWESR